MEDNQDTRYYYETVVDILADMVIAYLSESHIEQCKAIDQDNPEKAA